MLEGGEDPLYLARRLVRFASEDIGLADPQALLQAIAARDAIHFIGLPEGALALVQATVYLALAPKSNALYRAHQATAKEVRRGSNPPVPLHLRNAPTKLMEAVGYARGYVYAHDADDGIAAMRCLPDALAGRRFYSPAQRGFEKELAARLERIRAWHRRQADRLRSPAPGARAQDEDSQRDPDSPGGNA
jgi:putative ATPase